MRVKRILIVSCLLSDVGRARAGANRARCADADGTSHADCSHAGSASHSGSAVCSASAA